MGISKLYIFFLTSKKHNMNVLYIILDYREYLYLKFTDCKTITLYKRCTYLNLRRARYGEAAHNVQRIMYTLSTLEIRNINIVA